MSLKKISMFYKVVSIFFLAFFSTFLFRLISVSYKFSYMI